MTVVDDVRVLGVVQVALHDSAMLGRQTFNDRVRGDQHSSHGHRKLTQLGRPESGFLLRDALLDHQPCLMQGGQGHINSGASAGDADT